MSITIMESRYIHLAHALDGYLKTGVPLIEYDGTKLVPPFHADDIGIYYLIPKIAKTFALSLDVSIQIFFMGITLLAVAVGMAGFLLFYRSFATRLVACVGLLFLALLTLRMTDVYFAYAATAVAIIPWSLYFTQRATASRFFPLFTLLAGTCLGFFHYIRTNSGTAALIFLLLLIITMTQTKLKKMVLVGSLFLGMIFPILYFKSVFAQTKAYVQQHNLEGHLGDPYHPIWHPIYVGLGFLSNDFGLSYDDSVGDAFVQKIAPNTPYPSPLSEKILKQEVYRLYKEHFIFVVHTVGAKIGIILLYFLLFANFGILATFFYPQPWRILLAFFCALSFSALFGIIAVPCREYLLGFFTCAALFGITSINYAITRATTKPPRSASSSFFKRFFRPNN